MVYFNQKAYTPKSKAEAEQTKSVHVLLDAILDTRPDLKEDLPVPQEEPFGGTGRGG